MVVGNGLDVPDLLRILVDGTICRELPNSSAVENGSTGPGVLVTKGRIHTPLSLHASIVVCQNHKGIASVEEGVYEGSEDIRTGRAQSGDRAQPEPG
jgi:hypothetical protein